LPPKDFVDYLDKDRAKTIFPWAESTNLGTFNDGFGEGDPIWLDKNNWDFTGWWCLYQRWLAMDILIALFATAPLAAAYEFWSRRRWHYSLRFLLLCVLFVAVGMAWWRTGVNGYEREMKAVKALGEKVYDVTLHCDAPVFLRIFVGNNNLQPFTHVIMIACYPESEESKSPASLVTDADLEHLGDLTRLNLLSLENSSITDKTLERLHGLANLEVLYLDNTKITDEGLKTLRDLPRLRFMTLDGNKITGEGFKEWKNLPCLQDLSLENAPITDDSLFYLKAFPQLGNLTLSGTKVTDAGLNHLKRITNLKYLRLNGAQVTNAGLKSLESLSQLEKLELNGTKVSKEGIEILQRALPNCKIEWGSVWEPHNETEQPAGNVADEAEAK
jgi:hypothetical protein